MSKFRCAILAIEFATTETQLRMFTYIFNKANLICPAEEKRLVRTHDFLGWHTKKKKTDIFLHHKCKGLNPPWRNPTLVVVISTWSGRLKTTGLPCPRQTDMAISCKSFDAFVPLFHDLAQFWQTTMVW